LQGQQHAAVRGHTRRRDRGEHAAFSKAEGRGAAAEVGAIVGHVYGDCASRMAGRDAQDERRRAEERRAVLLLRAAGPAPPEDACECRGGLEVRAHHAQRASGRGHRRLNRRDLDRPVVGEEGVGAAREARAGGRELDVDLQACRGGHLREGRGVSD